MTNQELEEAFFPTNTPIGFKSWIGALDNRITRLEDNLAKKEEAIYAYLSDLTETMKRIERRLPNETDEIFNNITNTAEHSQE